MSRRDFHHLLIRYLNGECTPREKEWIDQWYQDLDEKPVENGNAYLEELETKLWKKISQETDSSEKSHNFWLLSRFLTPKALLLAVPSIALVLSFLWLTVFQPEKVPTRPTFADTREGSALITIENSSDSIRKIRLPDQSEIVLYRHASLQYGPDFMRNREVYLEGDAYFKVKANAKAPFYVYHQSTITKVLGTEFLITKGKGAEEEVTVYRGKVEVIHNYKFKNPIKRLLYAPKKIQLTANQRALLDKRSNELKESIAVKPIPILPRANKGNALHFKEITLKQLSSDLANIYAIGISVDDEMRQVTFTGDLRGMELFDQLALICQVTRSKYTVEGKRIRIEKD